MYASAAVPIFGHFKPRGPLRHENSITEVLTRMQVKVIVYVNHCGWIMGEIRMDGVIEGLRFTKARAGAKPYADGGEALGEVLRYVETTGCHYDLEREYFE